MLSASTIITHTRATLTTHHTHLHCTIITYTPEYSNSRLHTYMYISYYVLHTGANGGDLQGGDQTDPYIVLKTLKFLLREWAKDLNACLSVKKRSYQMKMGAGCLCIVRVCMCVYVWHDM